MASTANPVRPMRADARRNYERLLDAAKAAFAEHGTDAPLDDIAKRAGVGSGTLYRHFPTRLDLIEAVFQLQIQALLDQATELLAAPDAGEGLMQFLRLVINHSNTYRGLATALMVALNNADSAVARSCHQMIYGAGGRLLDRAQQEGAVRADVKLVDLLKLVNGISLVTEKDSDDPHLPDRLLALLVNGLRP
ncbi:AcrR family transcriptional regulator [Kibdelosporangium banguiense]|uniref:AcrR family transcriptional regulator n=1 Tax=Kibdelosporangium banguiense TaxID=1365924 RepID=A0ABS4TTA8_9PSEU|nr:TetR/AcrR family transcriptional regulator [Kibdelosporangium banguiense]MBP2327616.1 AcrR family transcriptional regulator [Kibdelosporangium banguiense]